MDFPVSIYRLPFSKILSLWKTSIRVKHMRGSRGDLQSLISPNFSIFSLSPEKCITDVMETRVNIQKVNNHNFFIEFDVIFQNLFIVLLIKFLFFVLLEKTIWTTSLKCSFLTTSHPFLQHTHFSEKRSTTTLIFFSDYHNIWFVKIVHILPFKLATYLNNALYNYIFRFLL